MNAKAYLFLINLSNFLVLESFRALAILGGIYNSIRAGAIILDSLRISVGGAVGIENVLACDVVLTNLEDGLTGPIATNHNIELGKEEAEKASHEGGHDERNHGLDTAKSALVGVGEPEVREGTGGDSFSGNGIHGFGEVVESADDQDSANTANRPKKGAQLGWGGNEAPVLGHEAEVDRKNGGSTNQIGDQKEGNDVVALRAHDDGGDVDKDEHNTCDEANLPILGTSPLPVANANEIRTEDGSNSGLKRVHGRGSESRDHNEDNDVPEIGQRDEQFEEGQVVKLLEVVEGIRIVGIGNHSHYTEEHHQKEDEEATPKEALAHGRNRLGGPNTLPGCLIEHLGGKDGNDESDGGSETVDGPVRGNCKFFPGDLILLLGTGGNEDNKDKAKHEDALELVGGDGSGQTGKRGVEPSKDGKADSDTSSVGNVGSIPLWFCKRWRKNAEGAYIELVTFYIQ